MKKLCASVHWPYTLMDIERLYRLEPRGWFCATVSGKYAGQAMGLGIESLGCVGIVIVHQNFRRQGIATALTRAALDYLGEKGIKTIKLDATPEGFGIYEKLKFRPEFAVCHYVRVPATLMASPQARDGVESLNTSGMGAVSQWDRKYFGVSRFDILQALLRDSEGFVLNEGRKVCGYAMVKPMDYENGYWLGPWVAEDQASAERILQHVLQRFGRAELRVGVLESNPSAEHLLKKHGFKVDFKITRMRFGPKLKRENPSGIYAEAGNEKG